jgi:hypothetical protein
MLAATNRKGFLTALAGHKLLALRAILTGWTLWAITGTNLWHNFLISYLNFSGNAMTLVWPAWSSHRWVYAVVPALLVCSYACLIGWLIGRFHPEAPVQVVAAFAVFLFLYEGMLIVSEAQNHDSVPTFIVIWALRDVGAVAGVIIGGILATRAYNRRLLSPR